MSKQIDKYSYNPNDLLGMGSIGRVIKAIDAKKNQYALRIIKKDIITDDEGMQSALLDEIRLMQKLKHPKIVQLIEVIQSDNNYYVVMELCKQDLQSFLQQVHKMPESECVKLLIDVLEGFTELIKHGVMHRGLKLSNVMLSDGNYKLADCGFSKCIENFKKDQSHKDDDFKFFSPQLLANSKYTNKCDIWSLGMILYNTLFGYTAWSGSKIEQLQHNIEHKLLEFPDEQTTISEEMRSFIEGCLAIDEAERMNWDDVFKHPLVKEHFKNYQTHIKEEQVKFLMNELRQKIIKQNIDIRKLFQELDENGDNTLQFSELVVLLHKIDKTLSRQDCQIIFKQLDLDGDKTVSFEEFAKWLTDNNTKMTLLSGKFKAKASSKTLSKQQIPSLSAIPQVPQQWPKQNENDPFNNGPMHQSIKLFGGTGQSQSMSTLGGASLNADPERTILKLKQAILKFNINIHDLFVKFDFDCDGVLNFQEFSQLCIKINRYAQPQELQAIFQQFDINCDSYVSFIEFRQILNLSVDRSIKPDVSLGGKMLQSVYQQPQQQHPYQQQQYGMVAQSQYPSQQRLPTFPTMI